MNEDMKHKPPSQILQKTIAAIVFYVLGRERKLNGQTMKTKTEDSERSSPNAEGDAVEAQVKTEFTFLWNEADEWKPAREARPCS